MDDRSVAQSFGEQLKSCVFEQLHGEKRQAPAPEKCLKSPEFSSQKESKYMETV